MSSAVNDTLGIAKQTIGSANESARHAVGTAKQALGSAREGAEHAVSSARSRWMEGIRAAAELVTMVRSLQTGDALGWIGLQRRRGALASLGVFGAGIAVGAGLGVLFAPTSGVEMRRRLVGRVQALKGNAENTLRDAAPAVKDAVEKAEETMGDLAYQVADAGRKVGDGARQRHVS
jgi:gas vesicle protein